MTIASFATPVSASAVALVDAPARLHLGFLDPNASLGRRFASLGLVIDGMSTRLSVSASARDAIEVPADCGDEIRERLARHLATLRNETGIQTPVRLTLHRSPPAHAGFGSGTQLALAVGRAFCACHHLDLDTARLAALLGRGGRSGVGIAGFDRGGLLLDGGPGADGATPPLLARIAFPPAWRVLLVLDERQDGLHGADERVAMDCLAPFPRELAAELCHQVLMRVLPGAMESEFEPFAEGVSTLQRLIGDYFAPAQGGSMYTSPAVARVLEWIRPRYCAGIGQSSWGPTGFAIVPSAERAAEIVAAARAAGVVDPALRLAVVTGRNHGARLDDQLSSPWGGRGSV
ncbi:MAG TPA: beta-ribofuranosylaminobenzene 5'-phosphate synthase family protein [Aromatoleum sp.]|uniref:beta-ribofuranosylaminobenzene 5'-phosphate synthase family protein n=1 Tax=Aromatoleum sp. TaxID=2307007 RepID=UPI002B47F24A|nr:beta-ribofuranosylaminobenzene 5'-phosphate synthase family protein [Aromatoleum sp.]HJV25862.1 beta-ribofuranosylaminobenzene 5'-phosphate synthase family protein [Aromatoleum sp.]